jgi:hypothetical protein
MRLPVALPLAALGVLSFAALDAGGRPPPPPDWSAHVAPPVLVPGAVVTYEYRVTSSDAFDLRVSLLKLPPQLALVKTGTSRYLVADGRPTWDLAFAGGRAGRVARTFKLRVKVLATARVGSRLCVTLRQVASNGGMPDVVALPVCATVQARPMK